MLTILLVLIYVAFISLGLPDSILGSAWPSMYHTLGVPISFAGGISIIVSAGTILSSLFSGKLLYKFGTGVVTAVSVFMTAIALLGFSVYPNYIWLCVCAIPLGLGAGGVDAALNNFVALHYKAKHMSWLHCFWGVGATLGPLIMSFVMNKNYSWSNGYQVISIMQFVLVAILIFAIPIWRKIERGEVETKEEVNTNVDLSLLEVLKLKKAKPVFITFFAYCAVETTTGLWGSSFLVYGKGFTPELAASLVSLYYFGITFGRFLSGFLTMRMNNKNMIRMGQSFILLGVLMLFLPGNAIIMSIGFFIIGFGCAPIYPCIIHDTPRNFGENLSQAVMGIQMAFAYVGTTCIPPLFGLIADYVNIRLFPPYLIAFTLLMFLTKEIFVNQVAAKEQKALN